MIALPITISITGEPPEHTGALGTSGPRGPAATITGAKAAPLSSASCSARRGPAPSEQLLRRQPVPTRNRRHRLAALIALGDDPPLTAPRSRRGAVQCR
jgi:hypothetical protein